MFVQVNLHLSKLKTTDSCTLCVKRLNLRADRCNEYFGRLNVLKDSIVPRKTLEPTPHPEPLILLLGIRG